MSAGLDTAVARIDTAITRLIPVGPDRVVDHAQWGAPARAEHSTARADHATPHAEAIALPARPSQPLLRRITLLLLAAIALAALLTVWTSATAHASPATQSPAALVASPATLTHASHAVPSTFTAFPATVDPARPDRPTDPTSPLEVTVDAGPVEPSTSIVVLVGMTVLAVAPSLLLMTTSFLKILVVLSLTRNALGLQGVPPNQVLAGIALFLSLFIMSPVVDQLRDIAIDPYLAGEFNLIEGLDAAIAPMREFMVGHTREEDIALLTRAAGLPNPATPADVPITTLIPAFMLSELRAAFVIGFVIFIPFLVIDLVVGAILMSMGMMMLPPVMISLPFKILLMVLVDGWGLIITTLVGSY